MTLVQLSLIDALDKGLDDLIPDEVMAFNRRIEEDPADSAPQLAFADWLAENSEAQLENAIRWSVARWIHPIRDGKKWRWVQWWGGEAKAHAELIPPDTFKYEFEKTVAVTFIGVMAKTAKILAAMQEELFGVKQQKCDGEHNPGRAGETCRDPACYHRTPKPLEPVALPEPETEEEPEPVAVERGEPVGATQDI